MEIDRFNKNTAIIKDHFIVKLLNDYEEGMISKKYIIGKFEKIKLNIPKCLEDEINENYELGILDNISFYPLIEYCKGKPFIKCFWLDYVPEYVIHKNKQVSQKILSEFNIKLPENYIKENYVNNYTDNYEEITNVNEEYKYEHFTKYPNHISKLGIIKKIFNNKIDNCNFQDVSDIDTELEFDTFDEDDSEEEFDEI